MHPSENIQLIEKLIKDFDLMGMGVFWDNRGCVSGDQGQTPWY